MLSERFLVSIVILAYNVSISRSYEAMSTKNRVASTNASEASNDLQVLVMPLA